VDKGADIDLVDKDGRSALSYAAQRGQFQPVQILVDKGADINLVDKDGQSALSYAAQAGNSPSVQILIDKGANIHLMDKDGQSAPSHAAATFLQGRRKNVAASNDVTAKSKIIIPSHTLSYLASKEDNIAESLQSLIIHDKHYLFLQAGFNQDTLRKGYLVEEIIIVCNVEPVECGLTDNLKLAFAAMTDGNAMMPSLVQQISKLLSPFPGHIILAGKDVSDNLHQGMTLFIPPWSDSGSVTWEQYVLDHSIPLSNTFASHSPISDDILQQKYKGSQILHLDESPSNSTGTPSNSIHSQSASSTSQGSSSQSSSTSGSTSKTSSSLNNGTASISGSGNQTQSPEPEPEDGDLYFSLTTALNISGSTLKQGGTRSAIKD
jgi:hypothetical protein